MRRMRRTIAQLPADCSAQRKLTRLLNAYLGARQVPVQQAAALVLGACSCPIVDCSRSFASLNISPQGERDATIDMRATRLRRTTPQPLTTVPSILATRPCRGMRMRVIPRAPCLAS